MSSGNFRFFVLMTDRRANTRDPLFLALVTAAASALGGEGKNFERGDFEK